MTMLCFSENLYASVHLTFIQCFQPPTPTKYEIEAPDSSLKEYTVRDMNM
jgi:hypothetical protein